MKRNFYQKFYQKLFSVVSRNQSSYMEEEYDSIDLNNFSLRFENLTEEDNMRLLEVEKEIKEEVSGDLLILGAYLLIIIVSLVGNSLVCKVTFANRTTTNSLIASLSISDLIVTVFNIPLNIVRLLMDNWPFGHIMCFLVPFVQIMAVYVSSLTMAVIAIHRWRSVTSRLPIRPCSRQYLLMTILGTWLLSGLMALPLSVFNQIQVVITYKPLTRCRNVYPDSRYDLPLILTIECFLTQYLIPLTMACLIVSTILRFSDLFI